MTLVHLPGHALYDIALQASQIHVSVQVLAFGKRLYCNGKFNYYSILLNKLLIFIVPITIESNRSFCSLTGQQ